MKKSNLTKRFLSLFTSVMLLVSFIFSLPVSAASDDIYITDGGHYSIEQILSDFSYFVNGDATITKHTVGAIAVGGSVSTDAWGDGATVPTYFNSTSNSFNINHGYTSNPRYNSTVYYRTGTAPASYTQITSPNYITMSDAFNSLKTESNALKNAAAKTITLADLETINSNDKMINLDLASATSFCIDADAFKAANGIVFTGFTGGSSGAQYFINNSVTVSILGTTAGLDFSWNTNGGTSTTTGVFYMPTGSGSINAQTTYLQPLGTLANNDVQMCNSGMKLIWNFPEATTVSSNFLSGHIVAPNAALSIAGGSGEGNVIILFSMIIKDNLFSIHTIDKAIETMAKYVYQTY